MKRAVGDKNLGPLVKTVSGFLFGGWCVFGGRGNTQWLGYHVSPITAIRSRRLVARCLGWRMHCPQWLACMPWARGRCCVGFGMSTKLIKHIWLKIPGVVWCSLV